MQKMGGQTVWCENEKFSGSAPRCIVPPKFLGRIDRDRVRNQEKKRNSHLPGWLRHVSRLQYAGPAAPCQATAICRANRTMSADHNMPGWLRHVSRPNRPVVFCLMRPRSAGTHEKTGVGNSGLKSVVGVLGLEPRASASRTQRATNCAIPRRLIYYNIMSR